MLLLADDHRYRNISHILNTLGISLTLLITTGCQYAAPSVSPATNTPNSSGLFPSFFGQTRVAPPPTGSYVNPMQRQKGTNNVSGTIQQPDSQRTLPPPVPRAGGNSSRRPDADSETGNTPAGNQDEVWPASFGPRGQSISQNGVSSAGYRVEQAQYMSEEGQFRGGLPATDLTAYGESPTPERRLDDQTLLTAGATTPISTQWSGNQVIHAKHDEEADVAHSGRESAEPNIGETLSWRNPIRNDEGQLRSTQQ